METFVRQHTRAGALDLKCKRPRRSTAAATALVCGALMSIASPAAVIVIDDVTVAGQVLAVGHGLSGNLTVNGASVLDGLAGLGGSPFSQVVLGATGTGNGSIVIDGLGSKLLNPGAANQSGISVGGAGVGTLSVTNGGYVQAPRLDSAGAAGSSATVSVSGGSNVVLGSTFNLGGGGTATATISGASTVSAESSLLGAAAGGSAKLTISGDGSMLKLVSGAFPVFSRAFLGVGVEQQGQLDVLAGGKVTLQAAAATGSFGINVGGSASGAAGANGVLIIDGIGSEIRLSGTDPSTQIGRSGIGVMNIGNGGKLIVEDMTSTNATAFVGRVVGSVGAVHVFGTGSEWQIGRQLRIGQDSGGAAGGTGSVDVSDGGTIRAVVVRVGAPIAGVGGGTLTGDGTVIANVVNQGTIAPGNSPGIMTVLGDVTLDSAGRVEIDIAGLDLGQYDRLDAFDNPDTVALEGRILLGGLLKVVLGGAFAPSLGSSFNVLTGTDIVEQNPLDIELPGLGAGLQWQHSVVALGNGREALQLAVTAVPEPSDFALFVAGLGLLFWRRAGRAIPGRVRSR